MYTFIKIRGFRTIATSAVLAFMLANQSAFAQVNNSAAQSNSANQPKLAAILNSGSASVSLIDMATRQVIKTIPVGKEPHHLMITPDQKTLLIANAAGNDVVLMNPTTGELTGRIPDIIDPHQITNSLLPMEIV
ncbi:YncE family protein [Polynucleobacter necessarius]|uniref:YncE family protein n=1 Tax=Polynucleobacter necessarius TaxID=576610 RepID=UPI001E57D735|nr:hypothetical protein [Polynucleobacter necessarius]